MSQALMNISRYAPINFSFSVSLLFHILFVLLLGRAFLLETVTPPIKLSQTKVHILPKKMPPSIDKQAIKETQIVKPVHQITPVKPKPTIPTHSSKAVLKESASISVTNPRPAQAVAMSPRQYGKRAMVQSAATASYSSPVSAAKPQLPTSSSGNARRATGIKHPTSVQAFTHNPSAPRSIISSSLTHTKGQGSGALVHSGATAFLSQQNFSPHSQTQFTDKGVLQGYLKVLQKDIAAAKSYPERERQAQHEGRVMIAFTLLKSGEIENLRLKEKSQYENLDQAALEAIISVTPFSGFPPEIMEDAIDVVIPFRFELK